MEWENGWRSWEIKCRDKVETEVNEIHWESSGRKWSENVDDRVFSESGDERKYWEKWGGTGEELVIGTRKQLMKISWESREKLELKLESESGEWKERESS